MNRTLLVFGFLLAAPLLAESMPEIRIGWSGPLSGNSAVLGIDSLQAVKLAVDEVNSRGGIQGRMVRLLSEDDQYDTGKAVSAYQKLAGQGVAAVLASTYGGVFATARRALKDNIIIINPLDCNNDIAALEENTFCIATESESIGRALAAQIRKRGDMPALIVYDEKNPFMELVQKVMLAELSGQAASLGVDQALVDFKPLLTRAQKQKPAAIVFLGHDPMGRAMREARMLGITSQFYTVGTITSPGFQELAGPAADGALVAFWRAPWGGVKYKEFLTQFKEVTGRLPILQLASFPSYDAANLLLEALARADLSSPVSRAASIRKELLNTKNYPGISGFISMDQDGAVRTIKEAVFEFRQGKISWDEAGIEEERYLLSGPAYNTYVKPRNGLPGERAHPNFLRDGAEIEEEWLWLGPVPIKMNTYEKPGGACFPPGGSSE